MCCFKDTTFTGMNLEQLKIISAGAGSGKTYRLTQEMVALLQGGHAQPSGIIATTFTRKAAAELQERVRVKLLSSGLTKEADELTNALIGTVHGLGVKLLKRFAFEAGVSPQVDILPDGEQQQMFNQALAATLQLELIEEMDELSDRLGLTKRTGFFDWRKEVRQLVDVARANDFSITDLQKSRDLSWTSFAAFLPAAGTTTKEEAHKQLAESLEDTIYALDNCEDTTKVTSTAKDRLRNFRREIQLRGYLYWHQWATIGKLGVGAKSREIVEPLQTFAWTHQELPAFQQDIRQFIAGLFDTAVSALQEYDEYKKRRGLIDYTDMEVLVSRLLNNEQVQDVLRAELDLLMVDEFQDTNPIQLEIFLKLSQLAKHSVWVGDPKQSIYGFRGAEPRLMAAIIDAAGGIKQENIQIKSWRSRADLVDMVNAIFCQAFEPTPPEQVALEAVRIPAGNENSPAEPAEMEDAIIHWHFSPEEGRRAPGKPWIEECIARTLQEWLASKVIIQPKGTKGFRPARPGDVAILCRSNRDCATVAESLHRAGLKAAIARAGLLATAEIRLVLACLKYILHADDSLSAAEIQVLAARLPLEEIVEDRLEYLEKYKETPYYKRPNWAEENDFIKKLDKLRPELAEASGAETLHQVLEELDLRRCIVVWGNSEQRLANVDQLRKLALEYENNCNNTHTAASLSGFLLWLNQLSADEKDLQGAGEDPQAVNVLTYHRSKGLEWPVVICHNLEQNLRADLWGVDLVAEQETVDLTQVLKGRWLRYWVNPYADQSARTPLLEALSTSEAQKNKTAQALAEEARLMYVGLTRARDYLIYPTQEGRPSKWLNRVWSKGDESIPALDATTSDTPWEWKSRFLDKTIRAQSYPRQFPVAESKHEVSRFMPPALGEQEYPLAKMEAVEILAPLGMNTTCGDSYAYFSSMEEEEVRSEVLVKVQEHFLKASAYLKEDNQRRLLARELSLRFGLPDTFDTVQLVEQAAAWEAWMEQQFSPSFEVFSSQAIHWSKQGRTFRATVDFVIETPTQRIFIQHNPFIGGDYQRPALDTGHQLLAAGLAWEASGRDKVDQYWVHFVGKGEVVEVLREG